MLISPVNSPHSTAVDRVRTDSLEHGPEVGIGIDAVQPGGTDEAANQRHAFPAPVGAGEEVVLASLRHGT